MTRDLVVDLHKEWKVFKAEVRELKFMKYLIIGTLLVVTVFLGILNREASTYSNFKPDPGCRGLSADSFKWLCPTEAKIISLQTQIIGAFQEWAVLLFVYWTFWVWPAIDDWRKEYAGH